MHFRQQNSPCTNYDFKIGPLRIDLTETYKYLGIFFYENVCPDENATTLAESAGGALGAVVSKLKRNNFMAFSTYSKLYNSCVVPVIDYASEMWGYKNL